MTRRVLTCLGIVLFTCACARRQVTAPDAPSASPSGRTDVEERSRQDSRPSPPPLGETTPSTTRQQLVREIDSSLERVKHNISMLQTRTPTAERQRGIARVETLLIQARDARTANDLSNARSLAERADLLSRDLLRTQ